MLAALFFRPSTIDPKALDALIAKAQATKTDALVVMVDGKVVLNRWFTEPPVPLESQSVTKSLANLAVGLLIEDGRIKGVDQPVRDFYPEYAGGGKERVTIRQLMEHSSGIQAKPTLDDVYAGGDFVRNALDQPLVSPPGTAFVYNNRAVNLLAGVVGKAAGEPMDAYLKRRVFGPLGIVEYRWTHDRVGNPCGMSGFQVLPKDLAKIGDFVRRGAGGGLPKGWMADSVRPTEVARRAGAFCGWLWWPRMDFEFDIDDALLARWKDAGMKPAWLDRYATLKGKRFATPRDLYDARQEAMKDDRDGFFASNALMDDVKTPSFAVVPVAAPRRFMAEGYLGQSLTIVPDKRIVAVRMRRLVAGETPEQVGERSFADFPEMAEPIVP